MSKEIMVSLKLGKSFREFLDNTRATRRSKIIGTDKELMTLPETCELLVNYFKSNPSIFQELIKFKGEENVR